MYLKENKMTKTKTDLSPFIVNVKGKDFITFPGLLQEAHALGLRSINTELLTSASDLSSPVVKATVILSDEQVEQAFTGYGDANPKNVAPMVAGALLRMAETRAIARALRFACNISMAALEELGGVDEDAPSKPTKSSAPVTQKAEEEVKESSEAQKPSFSANTKRFSQLAKSG